MRLIELVWAVGLLTGARRTVHHFFLQVTLNVSAAAAYLRVELLSAPYLFAFLVHSLVGSDWRGRRALLIGSIVYAGIATALQTALQIAWAVNPDVLPEGSAGYDVLDMIGVRRFDSATEGTILILPDPLVLVIAAGCAYLGAFKASYTNDATAEERDELLNPSIGNIDGDCENGAAPDFGRSLRLPETRLAEVVAELSLLFGIFLLSLTAASLPSIMSLAYAVYFCVAAQAWSSMFGRFFTMRLPIVVLVIFGAVHIMLLYAFQVLGITGDLSPSARAVLGLFDLYESDTPFYCYIFQASLVLQTVLFAAHLSLSRRPSDAAPIHFLTRYGLPLAARKLALTFPLVAMAMRRGGAWTPLSLPRSPCRARWRRSSCRAWPNSRRSS